MYSYTWDEETGGLLLNTTPLKFSKEPRPVYYQELDLLGFDKFWTYPKDDTYPFMWAEANHYWYRGRNVASTKGGTLHNKPDIILHEDPEPQGVPLRFIDIDEMVRKNKPIMDSLTQETIKKVYNTYMEYKDKVDIFYVAFSGGKDSEVTLDIVQRALPHNVFKVLFGDTGMEFPDTYKAVDEIERKCMENNIDFIRAKSSMSPEDSWRIFGPPATVTRWCCSVHKTVPQIVALREKTGKANFTGMAFIGIRSGESINRSGYDYISLGEKHKGQYSCNPIIEWNSAELYLYIYYNNIYINKAYKKGNRRAGCLVCPRAAERNEFVSRAWYTKEFDKYINIIYELYKKNMDSPYKLKEFIANGGWKARKNGRDLSLEIGYTEISKGDKQIISISRPRTDWKVWIKTIGQLTNDESPYYINFRNKQYCFEINRQLNGYDVVYDISLNKENPVFVKLLKNVFRKAASCVLCRECEADCHNGFINMSNGVLEISNKCTHCAQYHKVEKGCLVYKSLEMPKGGSKMLIKGSLNCYSHHAPKKEWFDQYFKYKNDFDNQHSLGSQMYNFFKRFLRDSELLDQNGFSHTAEIIDNIGLSELKGWAIMLANLAYTPQINWYIKRIHNGEQYNKDYTLSMLVDDGAKETWVNDIWSSLGRILSLPFSEVGLGHAIKEKNKIVEIVRTPWENPDPVVILYSLYKFAEACGGYYHFILKRLMDHDVESDGVSPSEIFGLDEDTMKNVLNGLSINYPGFINASFTLGLDNIDLREDKTSKDVLELF